jgi:peptide-methionine (S)-S-oxide reductase
LFLKLRQSILRISLKFYIDMKLFYLSMIGLASLFGPAKKSNDQGDNTSAAVNNAKMDTATFGTGCFWCTEAVFQQVEGVSKVVSGYSGGSVEKPTYKQVCTGTTGHAECLNIIYDPSKITFDELLEIFWQVHDPTTLNRQGNDIGTQYRSVVFYHNEAQKAKVEKYRAELDKSGAWDKPVVTALEPFKKFYPAEDYHQNYFKENGSEPYCQFVIRPKVEKFEKVFKAKLKKH